MYAKLFSSIYQGTLRGNTHGLVVFTNLLAHADSEGWVDIHPRAIAEEVGLPVEVVKGVLKQLEEPDPESRSAEENGRRIVRLDEHRDWGWRIVNHAKYRAIRSEEDRREQNRLAQQKYRESQKERNADNKNSKQSKPKQKQKQKQLKDLAINGHANGLIAVPDFETFWVAYPRKVKKPAAQKAFEALKPDMGLLAKMLNVIAVAKTSEQWQEQKYIPHPSTWLNNRRWEDEPELPLNQGHPNAVQGTGFVA